MFKILQKLAKSKFVACLVLFSQIVYVLPAQAIIQEQDYGRMRLEQYLSWADRQKEAEDWERLAEEGVLAAMSEWESANAYLKETNYDEYLANKNEVYEHEIIQILPFAFGLGDGNEIKNPLGAVVPRLEVSANIIYARKEKLDFMRKIIKKLGTRVKSYNFVYSEYAKMITELKIDEVDIYTENINYERLELEYKKIDSVSDWPRHYKLLLGLCLYGRGYNALYEVDSNGDVLLKGF